MNRIPRVNISGMGVVIYQCTDEATRVSALIGLKPRPNALPHTEVHANAVNALKQKGVKNPSLFDIRGQYRIQLGQYTGQTFFWLIENDIGYASYLIATAMREGSFPDTPLGDTKKQLKMYLESFPAGRRALQQRRRELEEKHAAKLSTKSLPSTSVSKSSKLVDSKLSPQQIAKRIGKKSSTQQFKPNIPSTSVARSEPPTSELGDEELLSIGLSMEAKMRKTLPAPHAKETKAITTDEPSVPVVVSKMSQQETKSVATEARSDSVQVPLTAAEGVSTVSKLSQLRAERPFTGLTLNKQDDPLPDGWRDMLSDVDQHWVSQALFQFNKSSVSDRRVQLKTEQLQLWLYPPQPSLTFNHIPTVDRYFAHRLLVWMPKRMWKVRLQCPNTNCSGRELTHAGLYPTVRQVLDLTDYYNLVTEYLECSSCGKKVIGWSKVVLDQLDVGHRYLFPVIMTYRYACDISVITLLRQRGLGNSASQLQRKLEEQHGEKWLQKTIHYLSACRVYKEASRKGLITSVYFHDPPARIPVPKYRWFQLVYCQDVMRRAEEIKAAITSTFGNVLKLDSTKKIAQKLAGYSANTAAWATNIGNEHGQVLMTVLTAMEGYGLKAMVKGIVERYASAGRSPPTILYVDRDCCGDSHLHKMFSVWPDLKIRLDVWHFMRRFSSCCNTDSHQLYGVFMSRLSKCIFEWSSDDLKKLREAKRSELVVRNVPLKDDADIVQHLTKRELALHCRRQTRGVEETTRLITELIEAFTGDQGLDTMGFPLLNKEKILNEWESQKKHVSCIQDPEGFSLYTKTGTLKKGTETLPTLRCARGSTSLESFHLHLARFIPGTVASDALFQAYLLDGLVRWNEDRAKQSVVQEIPGPSSYSGILRHAVNDLSQNVLDKKIVPEYQPPRKYTGELIGVEYLYSQTGQALQDFEIDPDSASSARLEPQEMSDNDSEDEGFDEAEEVEDLTVPLVEVPKKPRQPNVPQPRETVSATPSEQDPDETLGPDNISGYEKVEDLAEYLFTLREQSMALTNNQAAHIVLLWNSLTDFDKRGSKLSPRFKASVDTGRFRSTKTKTTVTPGLETTRRCFIGTGSGPAQWPNANRYMEALILKLLVAHPSPVKQKSKTIQRYSIICQLYKNIRQKVIENIRVMAETNIMLLEINQKTLGTYDKKRTDSQGIRILEQGISLPHPPMTATRTLPPMREKLPSTQQEPIPPDHEHEFSLPPITAGKGGVRRRLLTSYSQPDPVSIQPRPLSSSEPSSSSPMYIPEGLSRSTVWYKKRQRDKLLAGECVRLYKRRRETQSYSCTKCGKERSGDGHKHFSGYWWCSETSKETEAEWREKCREKVAEKKRRKVEKQQTEQQDSDN